MDRRTFLRTTAGAATGVLLGSCNRRGNPFGRGTGAEAPDPTRPSPRLTLQLPGGEAGFPSPFAYGPGSYGMMMNIYDSLLWIDPSGEIIPWLASSHRPSPDGIVHDFDLREEVRWHDGKPLTPEDVVFTFDYFETHRPKLPPFVLYKPEGVAEVKATGPRSVQIRLDKPRITFARNLLATFPIFPKHVWSGIDNPVTAEEMDLLVGTGPYRLKAYQRGKGAYLFNAFDNFFLGKPYVKRLELQPVGDQINALVAGQVDGAAVGGSAGRGVLARLRGDPRFGVLSGPLDGGAFLYFDPSKKGPVADVRFRRACALAIDRNDLVRRVLGGNGAAGNPGFLPPDHPFRVEVEQYRFNPKAAERLLDEAGYQKGPGGIRQRQDGQPLRMKTMVIPDLAATFEVVQRDLKAVGIDIFPDPVEPIQVFSGAKLDYEMSIRPLFNLAADPDFMRTVFSSRVEQRFFAPQGYANPELDELGEQQLVLTDLARRRELIARMQQIIAADLPFLPLYYEKTFFVFDKSVFNQWSYEHSGGGPTNKQILVTGLNRGTKIRPIDGA